MDERRTLKVLALKTTKEIIMRGQSLVRRGDSIGEVFIIKAAGQLSLTLTLTPILILALHLALALVLARIAIMTSFGASYRRANPKTE